MVKGSSAVAVLGGTPGSAVAAQKMPVWPLKSRGSPRSRSDFTGAVLPEKVSQRWASGA